MINLQKKLVLSLQFSVEQLKAMISDKQSPIKRDRVQQRQKQCNQKPRKYRKTVKVNPFQELFQIQNKLQAQKKKANQDSQNGWVKAKTTPLTIQISDHSKVNKFFSHKSLQKYIRYLYTQTCPNPMWLSIKRKSQIKKIFYIDAECQNSVFHRNLQKNQQNSCLQFLRQFVCPANKAIFKQAPFLKESQQLWQAMFVYDELAIKQDMLNVNDPIINKNLPKQLTPQLFSLYKTYILSEQQRKNNLYPIKNLPAYKQYFKVDENCKIEQDDFNNKILVIDCEMVMSANGFELARTSIMNFSGKLIYDQFFKPQEQITNYNTQFSGITAQILKDITKSIKDLHIDLEKIITKDTILVGHSLQNDLHAMKFMHDNVIDTSVLFSRRNGSKMKLKTLSQQILNKSIQNGSHCSQQDCQATLQIMRYKIQIKEIANMNTKMNFHLLHDLSEANKNILVMDSNLEFIRHRVQYKDIKFCVINDNNPCTVLDPLKLMVKQQQNIKIDIGFARIRKQNSHKQWQDYYKQFDNGIRQFYNQIPPQTVLLVNCQINPSTLIYPQQTINQSEKKRTCCIIVVKST